MDIPGPDPGGGRSSWTWSLAGMLTRPPNSTPFVEWCNGYSQTETFSFPAIPAISVLDTDPREMNMSAERLG